MAIQLLLLLASLAATAIAVFSDTKHFERRRLTRLGLLTLVFALVSTAAGASLVVTQARAQELEQQRRIALNRQACITLHRSARQLATSVSRLALLTPDSAPLGFPPPPLDKDSFQRVAQLNLLGPTGTLEASPPLDAHVTDIARAARTELSGALARYATSLDSRVLAKAEALLSDPFLTRLSQLSPIMRVGVSRVQRDIPALPRAYFPLFLASEWPAYIQFQHRIDELIHTCILVASEPAV